jgi:hypothetical protein
MSQRLSVTVEPALHHTEEGAEHAHRAYGVYDEANQSISLDTDMGHERQRETFLHENLHAMLAIGQLDSVLDSESGHGASEHVVSVLSPILLAWMRDNPNAVNYLREEPT